MEALAKLDHDTQPICGHHKIEQEAADLHQEIESVPATLEMRANRPQPVSMGATTPLQT
jgi:hypothetical protein